MVRVEQAYVERLWFNVCTFILTGFMLTAFPNFNILYSNLIQVETVWGVCNVYIFELTTG